MKHTLPFFSRTTISGLLLLLLLLLLESKTGQMKTPNGSTQHEAALAQDSCGGQMLT